MRILNFLNKQRGVFWRQMLRSTTFWVLLAHLLLLLILFVTFTRSAQQQSVAVTIQNSEPMLLPVSAPKPAATQQARAAKRQKQLDLKRKAMQQQRRLQAEQVARKMRAAKVAKEAKAAKLRAAKAAAEKLQAKQKAKRIADLQRQALALQQKQLKQQQQKQLQALKQAQLQARLQAARSAMLNKYTQRIVAQISQNWLVPAGVARSLQCTLSIHLAPGGMVLGVELAKSSGNQALDNSAIAAVYKASPLPVPTGDDFAQFRQIQLRVQPLQTA